MKKTLITIGLFLLTLQGGCQEDKIFKEVVTFEKGFKFSPTGQIQTIPFLGNSTNVTWESIIGKPSTFPPSAHTHPYTEVTGTPTVDLQSAISSMQVIVIPKLTTVQINALTPIAGSLVYDTNLNVFKAGNGTTFKILITNQ